MSNKMNLLWILLDTCRQDRMSCYGYDKRTTPFLEKIAEKAIIFENAISNSNWTYPSVASMFTGLYPAEHGAHNINMRLKKNKVTIAQVLKNVGYHTIAISQNSGWINPLFGLPRGFQKLYDNEKINISPFPKAPEKISDIINWGYRFTSARCLTGYENLTEFVLKKELKQIKKPFFLFLQLMDTHLCYLPPVRFQKFGNKRFPYSLIPYGKINMGLYRNLHERRRKHNAGLNEFSNREFKLMNELYDGCVNYCDFQIKKIIDFLKNEGLLENTIIVITADHGEHIGEYNLLGHVLSLKDKLIKVPLIIKFPENYTYERKRLYEQIEMKDIYFLLNKLLINEKFSGDIQNGSILNYLENGKGKKIVFGEYPTLTDSDINKYKKINSKKYIAKYSKFARSIDFKYIQYDDGKEELYSLKHGEKRVSIEEYNEEYTTLKKAFNEWDKNLNDKIENQKIKSKSIQSIRKMKEKGMI